MRRLEYPGSASEEGNPIEKDQDTICETIVTGLCLELIPTKSKRTITNKETQKDDIVNHSFHGRLKGYSSWSNTRSKLVGEILSKNRDADATERFLFVLQ